MSFDVLLCLELVNKLCGVVIWCGKCKTDLVFSLAQAEQNSCKCIAIK